MILPLRPPSRRGRHQGFALVSTLAVLVIVAIVLVAYASTMQSERAASQNFTEHDRGEAVALGMLNRILVEHASPKLPSGVQVQPFAVDPESALPTDLAAKTYYGSTVYSAANGPVIPTYKDKPTLRAELLPVYVMEPDDEDEFARSGLVRTSKSADSTTDAYNADYWAYDGLTEKVLGSTAAQPLVVPQWVDYYESDPTTQAKKPYPSAQIAFAIWDEGGKFDVNMVGKDEPTGSDIGVNGLAPHDLKLETELASDPAALLKYLNGADGRRQRNNFGLRQILSPLNPSYGTLNDKGDDRWLFSVRELFAKTPPLLKATDSNGDPTFRQVTTISRDFDVRPEWDGDRRPLATRKIEGQSNATVGSESFLRSYINNPSLFGLFYGAGSFGPSLVKPTLNQKTLEGLLKATMVPNPTTNEANKADWMQVLRLLAVLRRSLPPYNDEITNVYDPEQNDPRDIIKPSTWSAHDIFSIGQNVIQASAPASDHNLVTYNAEKYPTGANTGPFKDPGARVGIRISPYITEVATKMEATPTAGEYKVTDYIEIWNPFPFALKNPDGTPILYRVGEYTGNTWPNRDNGGGGLYARTDGSSTSGRNRVENVPAPNPGEFKVIAIGPRTIGLADGQKLSDQSDPIKGNGGFEQRPRPFIQDMKYYPYNTAGIPDPIYYTIGLPSYFNKPNKALFAFFDVGMLPTVASGPRWYSFQIDDPRMGSMPRKDSARLVSAKPKITAGEAWPPLTDSDHRINWIGYTDKHSLASSTVLTAPNGQMIEDPSINTPGKYNGKTFNGIKGYNANFGTNWPGASTATGVASNDNAKFQKMMATFALPGRPLLNIGELSTVFAFRPWTTLNFANQVIPTAMGNVTPAIQPSADVGRRPAAILDYFTTIGTTTTDTKMNYVARNLGAAPAASIVANQTFKNRYQDKSWLFESLDEQQVKATQGKTQTAEGNLRAIRGRINLNTASEAVLTKLLAAPYRMPASLGLKLMPAGSFQTPITRVGGGNMNDINDSSDYIVTIKTAVANNLARAIALPTTDGKAIRPLRTLSDLSQLYDLNPTVMQQLHNEYPASVINAMIGRLAQFGTVRQQAYTIDLVARALNPKFEEKRAGSQKPVVTGEVRLQARVFFDSFSRKAFIESIQYR